MLNIELTVSSAIYPSIFSTRHVTAFLHWETLDSPSALSLEDITSREIPNKKYEMTKMWQDIYHEKDTCL